MADSIDSAWKDHLVSEARKGFWQNASDRRKANPWLTAPKEATCGICRVQLHPDSDSTVHESDKGDYLCDDCYLTHCSFESQSIRDILSGVVSDFGSYSVDCFLTWIAGHDFCDQDEPNMFVPQIVERLDLVHELAELQDIALRFYDLDCKRARMDFEGQYGTEDIDLISKELRSFVSQNKSLILSVAARIFVKCGGRVDPAAKDIPHDRD